MRQGKGSRKEEREGGGSETEIEAGKEEKTWNFKRHIPFKSLLLLIRLYSQ